LVVIFNTPNSFGGGDNYAHFKLVFLGWKHPELLFSYRGKPLFTILLSPFAQLEINYTRIFNLISELLTSYFSWMLARELKLENSWMIVFLVVFTQICFSLIFAVLIGVLQSMLLVLAVLLFFKKKYIWSAVFASFLPIIRNESVILLPFLIIVYLLQKQLKAIPFLITGFVIISLLGWRFYVSLFWIITKVSYEETASVIYGHGNLFSFVVKLCRFNAKPSTLGCPVTILFFGGFVKYLLDCIKKDNFKITNRFYFLLLLPVIFLMFLAAHSFVWWKDMGNSLGLIRIVSSVIQLAALTALAGLNLLTQFISRNKKNSINF
jgi:hypothetical protein